MGLGAQLITFTASSLIRSADMNANMNALNNSTAFNGGVPLMAFDSGKLLSDGSGNIQIQGGNLGKSAAGDMLQVFSNLLGLKATTAIIFSIGGSSTTPAVPVVEINSTGIQMLSGGLQLAKGSLSRISYFSGIASGTFNHGLGVIPSMCFPINTSGGNGWYGANSFTPTTVYILGANAFTAFCAAF